MKLMRRLSALLLCLSSLSASARPIDVPADKAWQHARTGVILRSHLGGLVRASLEDAGSDEVDLAAGYNDAATGTIGTIFLFHPGIASVPMWFDRAQSAMLAQKVYGTAEPASPVPSSVKPEATQDSLRIVYAMQGGEMQSIGLAAIPVGDWLLIVRLSSHTLDRSALDARLTGVLNEIGLPANRPAAPVATPIAACPNLLTYKKARLLSADMTQALLNAMLPQVATKKDKSDSKPVTYCRDREAPDAQWAVYRADADTKAYVMSLGDGGSSISVAPALVLKGGPAYSITLYGLDRLTTYPNVSALLPPEQAYDIVAHTRALTAVSTLHDDGKTNITINSAALGKNK